MKMLFFIKLNLQKEMQQKMLLCSHRRKNAHNTFDFKKHRRSAFYASQIVMRKNRNNSLQDEEEAKQKKISLKIVKWQWM
jgi:hypothetical protein